MGAEKDLRFVFAEKEAELGRLSAGVDKAKEAERSWNAKLRGGAAKVRGL